MPDKGTLRASAQVRLDDARALFDKQRYDGAAYICGYAVEFALKARICETLDIDLYPEKLPGFKIHELETLLLLSGRKRFINDDPTLVKVWSAATDRWKPDMRYQAAGAFSKADAQTMLEAVEKLLLLL